MRFQDMILELEKYWGEQGCVITQPYDTEVGAGTFYPTTFLRALGPDHWRTAYVAPSRRPQDGRYGENPYRFQYYFQYQVILKPSPENVQELYLNSLERLGIRAAEHDIRFVEDNWESPTLGAWGLGWEVWLDGMEITQFTYFQQIGGFDLKPITVEITYGLERIALYLQGKDHAFDLEYGPAPDAQSAPVTVRNLREAFEVQHCEYNFSHVNADLQRTLFDAFEGEARRLVALHLIYPGYEFVMRCSHAFNLLDARGAISHAERQAYVNRVRSMARLVAQEYLQSLSAPPEAASA